MKNIFLSNNVLSSLFYLKLKDSNIRFLAYETTNHNSPYVDSMSMIKLHNRNRIVILLIVIKLILTSYIVKFDKLYIGYPTFFSVIIAKFSRVNSITYLDDGTTFFEQLGYEKTLYQMSMEKKKIKSLFFRFLNINIDSLIHNKLKKLTELIVFHPHLYINDSRYRELSIKDAQDFIPEKSIIVKMFDLQVEDIIVEKSSLILTQPFQERNISGFGNEMKLIKNYINNRKNSNFILKLHPSETANKYDKLENITIYTKKIPAEIILLTSNISEVIGFFSASLFNFPLLMNLKVVSLINPNTSEISMNYYKKLKKLSDKIKFQGENI